MKRSLAAVATAAALLGACSTDKAATDTIAAPTSAPDTESTPGGSTAPSTETTAPTESTYTPVVDQNAPGVSDTEIKVGINLLDLSTVKNILGIDQGDAKTPYEAVIAKINADGGINGRKLVPVYNEVDPVVSDSATSACTRLTQDDPVFVAVGFFLSDSVLCYVQDNGTPVIGGTQTSELLSKSTVPWLSWSPSEEQGLEGFVALANNGQLTGSVGVLAGADDQQAWENVILPALQGAGVDPVDVAFVDTSTQDANIIKVSAQNALAQFESKGVDRVLLVGGAGSFGPLALAGGTYKPSLVFSQLDIAQTYSGGAGNDLSVLDGALSVAKFDAGSDFGKVDNDVTKECLATQTGAGLELVPAKDIPRGQPVQITSSINACMDMYLLKAVLEKAGPTLNRGTYANAVYNLGDVVLPGFPDSWHFDKGHPDGHPTLYAYAWDGTAQRWVAQA